MTKEEATIYIKEWLKDEYLDCKDRAALTAIIKESEQEPKYCDRNICIQNEYNGIGCGECEVTKSGELSSCESCMNGNQEEKAKLCQKSYLAGMKHSRQEPCEDAISRQAVLEYINRILNQGTGKKKSFEFIQKYVEKLPPVNSPQPKTDWIPVSDRLPEDVLGGTSDDVLICVTDSLEEAQTISTGFYSKPDQGWWSMWAYGCHRLDSEYKVTAWMPLPAPYKAEARTRDKKFNNYWKYIDIYNEFCDKFPLAEVEDYRPAIELYVPQLSKGIPNAIIVWLKDGTKVIYIAESEDKE